MATPTRKIGKWACDGCKLRKIKCSGVSPCPRCVAAGLPCTFNKRPLTRGPRNLRAKTIRQITATQLLQQQEDQGGSEFSGGMSRTDHTPPPGSSDSPPSPDDMRQYASPNPPSNTNTANSDEPRQTSMSSLVLRLCIYRLRLFPVWPIVDVEEIMGRLHREPENMDAYALANAVGAATIAQLKLEGPENGDMETAALMEAECQRAISLLRKDGQEPSINLNAVRVSFFLHVYHENRSPGGSRSLLYLREAITIAQIMGLHREATYSAYTAREQQMRRRILSLLFVTERGVAMLHKLPVMLRYNSLFMDFDDTYDETHVLPAFKKLVTLFWMFDQSGAFDILHTSDEIQFPDYHDMQALNRNCLSLLQRQLREIPIQSRHGNDVQTADICVTRQWMQVILWRASMKRSFTVSSSDQQATSLSHPIQLAKEFLDIMSQIPSSAMEAHGPAMEYKIYEIAKAVTDSIMTESNAQATALVIPTEILLQLRSKLASCRGGNKILLPRLHAHISDALLRHSLRIYDITDHRPSTRELSQDAIVYSDHQAQPQPSKSLSRTPPLRMNNAGHDFGHMIPLEDEEVDSVSGGMPWNENDTEVLLPPDHDLFNQAQMFQGSFNNMQTTGTMELLFANSTSWNSVETWNTQADATMGGNIMNGMPNTSD